MKAPSSIYPFIFRLIKSYNSEAIDETNTVNTLKIIESFLVRRSLAGFEPTGLHAVFKDLWNETKGIHSKVTQSLLSKKTIQFPSDAQLTQDIHTKPLYGRKLAPYIIMQYEQSFDKGDVTNIDASFEIDHIVPQSLDGDWLNSFSPEKHKKYIDIWANLVPLTKNGNIQKSRKNWNEANSYLGKESVFKSTRNIVEKYPEEFKLFRDKIFPIVMKWEGGGKLHNVAGDSGGWTIWGIAFNYWKSIFKNFDDLFGYYWRLLSGSGKKKTNEGTKKTK